MLNIWIDFSSFLLITIITYKFITTFLPKTEASPMIYKRKKLKNKKVIFNLQMATIYKYRSGFIWATNDGKISFKVADKKICEISIDILMPTFQNINSYFCRQNYFVNENSFCFEINKNSISTTNLNSSILLKISKPKLHFVTNTEKGVFFFLVNNQIFGFRLTSGKCTKIFTNTENIYFSFDKDFTLSWIGDCEYLTKSQSINLIKREFGVVDTTNWSNSITASEILFKSNSIKSHMLQNSLKIENWKIFTKLYKIIFKQVKIQDFITVIKPDEFWLDLSSLGFSKLISINFKNKLLEINDILTGYKTFLKFGQNIVFIERGCYWGNEILFIKLKGSTTMQFSPFTEKLDFNSVYYNSILSLNSQNQKKFDILYSKPKQLDFVTILELINRAILQGVYIDLQKLFCGIMVTTLPKKTQFAFANLMLSFMAVKQDFFMLYDYDFRKFLISQCKNLDKISVGEARCFVKKILPYLTDDTVINFLLDYLEKTKNTKDYACWEYVYSEILGVNLRGSKVFFTQKTDKNNLHTQVKIRINDKIVQFINKNRTQGIICNDRLLVDINYIDLSTNTKKFLVEI